MKYAAELFGTFCFLFSGLGTAVLATHVDHTGVALGFGLALLAMVYTVGPISGCHLNPAVTFGMLLSRRIGGKQAAGYMVAQIAGAILADVGKLLEYEMAPDGTSRQSERGDRRVTTRLRGR